MRSNAPAEIPKNFCLRNFYYPVLDGVILQIDQRFSGHAEAALQLSSLLSANVVATTFCEVKRAQSVCFFSFITGTIDKSQSFNPCSCQDFVKIILILGLEKSIQTLLTGYFFCSKNTKIQLSTLKHFHQYSLLLSNNCFLNCNY